MTAASISNRAEVLQWMGRHECDLCGDWHAELRLFTFDGWVPDERWCRECFGTSREMDFTDFPIIQEAMAHV